MHLPYYLITQVVLGARYQREGHRGEQENVRTSHTSCASSSPPELCCQAGRVEEAWVVSGRQERCRIEEGLTKYCSPSTT